MIQADKRRYLVAKLVSVETSQVLSLFEVAPATDELGPQVDKLAVQVAEVLTRQPDRILPKFQPPADRLAILKKQLGQKKRPARWIGVPERAVGAGLVPDPAAQTELLKIARETGFPVVDAEEGAKGRAEVLLTGEGLSEVGGRHGNLVTVKARVEVKAVDRVSGQVLVADRQAAVVVDLTEQLASKAALQQAAAVLAERTLPKLARD